MRSDDTTAQFRSLVARVAAQLSRLPDKPEETPDSTIRALWQTAAGRPMSVERADATPLPALSRSEVDLLEELIDRRMRGTPLAYLTGRQSFMGLELHVSEAALIPRRETELLGRGALAALQRLAVDGDELLVVDVCSGSGNLALALASQGGAVRVFAADLSDEAIALAQHNARQLGLSDRVEFRTGDLLAPFDEPAFHGQVHLLVCNPPYISSRTVDAMPTEIISYEPRLAFDGGPLGIRIVERLIREAPRFLAPNGVLAFEVGLGQGPALMKRVASNKSYTHVNCLTDEAGHVRVILAQAGPAGSQA